MKNHILDDKMQLLYEMVIQMVAKVEEQIQQAMIAFRDSDKKLADSILEKDKYVDEWKQMIEDDVIRILITEAPYGRYLRETIAIMKMVSNIARVGDHACKLAGLAYYHPESEEAPCIKLVCDMALLNSTMLRDLPEAFSQNDGDKARMIAERNKDMHVYLEAFMKQLYSLDTVSPEMRARLYDYYYIAKEMGSIGEHITHMCSWIMFADKGTRLLP